MSKAAGWGWPCVYCGALVDLTLSEVQVFDDFMEDGYGMEGYCQTCAQCLMSITRMEPAEWGGADRECIYITDPPTTKRGSVES